MIGRQWIVNKKDVEKSSHGLTSGTTLATTSRVWRKTQKTSDSTVDVPSEI
jgi:hypothetical protein